MKVTHSFLYVIIICLFSSTFISHANPDGENPHIQKARQEFESAQMVLSEVTNETDRLIWQKRVDLAERELANAIRQFELEQEERRFASKRRLGADYALREALRAIETDTESMERTIANREEIIKNLKKQRSDIKPIKETDDESEQASQDRAETEARIRNIDTEILARSFERDTAELQLKLAQEAIRIETFRQGLDINPRPTIKLIRKKQQAIDAAKNKREEIELLIAELETRLSETSASLELTQERFEHIDDEISLLNTRYRVEKDTRASNDSRDERKRRIRQVRNMLNTARSEKNLLGQRMRYIEDQREALVESLALTKEGNALLNAEIVFRQNDLDILKRRFFRRILTPFGIVLALIILNFLACRFLFPYVLNKDSLFVARRLSNYVLVLLIIIVLTAFFLEDLKAIATVMGIVGAAIVIALQDLCSSFAGWFVIVTGRKIKVGNRVEIDGHRGDILDIQMLRTTLLEVNNWLGVDEPTGRIIIIPNSFIFKYQVFNYSHIHPHIWGKIDVTVTFETPPQEAFDTLMKVLTEETEHEFSTAEQAEQRMEKTYGTAHVVYKPKIHTVIADSGVCYSLFYVSHYKRFSATKDKISARILDEFEKNPHLEFAYPTERHIPTTAPGEFVVTTRGE